MARKTAYIVLALVILVVSGVISLMVMNYMQLESRVINGLEQSK